MKSIRLILLVLFATSCGTKTETKGVSVKLGAAASAANKRVSLASGRQVELTVAKLKIHSVELTECPTATARLLGLFLPTAYAHAGTAKNHLEGPFEFDLLGSAADWGTITPPAGDYCGVELTLSSEAPTRHGDEPHDDSMLILNVSAFDVAEPTTTFSVKVDEAFALESIAKMTLGTASPTATLRMGVALDKLLLGIDTVSETERVSTVRANLSTALSVAVEK
jgi:hypothetical protein